MPPSPGDLLATKYRIEAEIGRGAFGRVYRARDIALDRVVAIKELHRGEDDLGSTAFSDYVRRFEREARVQARFNHPNIVHVYELLRLADDRLYLVMEYVDGESLRDTLARRGPLPVDETVRIMLDLLAGLAAVHADERDIVHRDIKPSNVMLTKAGQAKLADFGLAQVGDESLRSGSAGQTHPGSPLYMSPEQETTNAYLYPTSDVFSAGCVLFELLTGKVYKQTRRHKKELTDLRPNTPEWLADVLAQALARYTGERFADAEEMEQRISAGQGMATLDSEQARQIAAEQQSAEAARQQPLWQRHGIELISIPAGEFLYGEDQQKITLPEYWIAKTPVTNAQYKAFVDTTGHRAPNHWSGRQIPNGKENHPVVNVSWDDAQAFCAWAGLQLPSEQQWEKAARGSDGREYPWGTWELGRCNSREAEIDDTNPVDRFPGGASFYSALDMAGNVWEWCADLYQSDQDWRVLRGGAFVDDAQYLRCANRDGYFSGFRLDSIGFRVASPDL